MKIAFADLDGTLLNDQKQISTTTVRAIRRWQQAGNQFLIASGRYYRDVQGLLNQVDLNLPIIALNGAVTLDRAGEVLDAQRLQADSVVLEQVQAFCEAHHLIYLVYCTDGSYVRQYPDLINNLAELALATTKSTSDTIRKMQFYFGQFYGKSTPVTVPFALAQQPAVLKFEIFTGDPSALDSCRELVGDAFEVSYSSPRNLELTAKGVNKGLAVQHYLAGVKSESVTSYAFGNGQNDLSLFKAVDLGVAVANAPIAIRQAADKITVTNNAAGVAAVLNGILDETEK